MQTVFFFIELIYGQNWVLKGIVIKWHLWEICMFVIWWIIRWKVWCHSHVFMINMKLQLAGGPKVTKFSYQHLWNSLINSLYLVQKKQNIRTAILVLGWLCLMCLTNITHLTNQYAGKGSQPRNGLNKQDIMCWFESFRGAGCWIISSLDKDRLAFSVSNAYAKLSSCWL